MPSHPIAAPLLDRPARLDLNPPPAAPATARTPIGQQATPRITTADVAPAGVAGVCWELSAPGPTRVMYLAGQLTLDTLRSFGAGLDAILDDPDTEHVIVDVGALLELDAVSVGVLNRAIGRLRERGGRLTLAGATPAVRARLRDGGLDRSVSLLPAGLLAQPATLDRQLLAAGGAG